MKIPSTLITLIILITTSVINADRAIIPNDVYNSYTLFLHNRPALSITDFSGEHTRRDVVETIIWQQALINGGYNKPINIEGLDVSYSRVILELKHGTIHAFANSVWLEDTKGYEDSFYISDILIPENKFYAGFYATPERVKEIEIKDKKSISNYKFSCNRHWTKDNQLLDHLKADCMFSNTWKTMIEKLRDKHADIVLAPFQANDDISLMAYNIKLLPVPNIKTSLLGRRVFIVSKKSENGDELFKALNKGIKLMHKEGLIEKAYKQSGFYNDKIKDWKLIN